MVNPRKVGSLPYTMTHCPLIVQSLAATNSILDKKAIIAAQVQADNPEFFAGFRLAYDPLITFGVKKVPERTGDDGPGLNWIDFIALTDKLRQRAVTGKAATQAISAVMQVATNTEWNDWYRRILIKDMRCGTSDTILNDVVEELGRPDLKVPVFTCQLAKDGVKHPKKLVGRKIIDSKWDGVRALTVIDVESRQVYMVSRNGQPLNNFPHIVQSLTDNIDLFERSWVLDGEVMSADFQQLMTQLRRKSDVQTSDSVVHLFDIVPLSEFLQGSSTMGQRRRKKLLDQFRPIFDKTDCVSVADWKEIDLDTAVGQVQYDQINREAIAAGLEGIMLKDPDALYTCKRTDAWLKIKPSITVDLTIVGIEEGTGKYTGMLGSLICSGVDDGRHIQVNVGSGISDEQRDEWFQNLDYLRGQVIEVRADAVTQNQDGTYSLRFPRFVRFRGFKVGEKI